MSRSTPAVVVAALLVVLAGVAPAGVGVLDSAPVGTAQASPSGFVGVPSENVDEDVIATYDGALTAAALDGRVMASSNASTLDVLVVSSEMAPKYQNSKVHGGNVITEGDVGLVLRDDVNHAGREVALPADVIRAQFGYLPEAVHGAHENGSRWTSATRVEDGSLIFEVPHFSTQTVALESEVRLTGSEATDDTTWRYNISNDEAVENVSTTLTGIDSTEVDTVSGAGLANGDSLPLDVAGTDPATGAEVTFGGKNHTSWANESGVGISASGSDAITVGGDADPVGPSVNNEPTIEVTATDSPSSIYNPVDDEGDGTADSTRDALGNGNEMDVKYVPVQTGKITNLTLNTTNSYSNSGGLDVDVYIIEGEGPDATFAEGTKVKSGWTLSYGGEQTTTLDTAYDVTKGTTYSVGFVLSGADNGLLDIYTDTSASSTWLVYDYGSGTSSPNEYVDLGAGIEEPVTGVSAADGAGNTASLGDLNRGQTKTAEFDVAQSAAEVNFSATSSGTLDYTLNMQEVYGTDTPGIDVDGDGTDDATHSGVLLGGESATYALPDLAVGGGPATISTVGNTTDATVTMTEHSVTEDVDVLVNGNAQSHVGTLGPGNTTTLDHADSTVVSGENNVTTRVAPGLSTDAPAAKVGVNYSHDAERTFSADIAATKWEETHNVSETLASDRDAVTFTLPYSSDAVALHSVETRTNGGAWSSVSSSSYSFDGTNLTVDTGSALEGDTVAVRATARRVVVENGEISVEEPTVEGDDLNTLIEVTSKSSGFHIRTQNTTDGRLPYLGSKSWTGEPHAEVRASGAQHLYLPDASVGSTARVKSLPMTVTPEAGAIEVVVEDPSEPQFRLRTGNSAGADTVNIEYNDTVSGETYRLWSVTQDREVMADTAESPVYFSTDGDDETYLIEVKDGSGGTQAVVAVGGGDGGGPLPVLALFLGVAGSIVGVFLLGRKLGVSGRRWNALLVGVGAIVGLVGVELATGRSVVSDVLFALGDVVGGAASTGAGAVVIGVGVLLALYGFHSRIWSLPLWMRILTFGAVVLWIVDELSGGAFTATLGELGPLLWLIMALGGIALLWRALQGPTFNVVGVRK